MRRCMATAIMTQALASSLTPLVSGSQALYGDRHHDAGLGILLDASGFRVAKKQQHRVADILVDGRTVLECDGGHLGQVVIENVGKVFRLQVVRGLGEGSNVGKEDR